MIPASRPNHYIPQKFCFQGICSTFLAFWHGHSLFWPLRLCRLLEAKNHPQQAKKDFLKKVFDKSCLKTSNLNDTSQKLSRSLYSSINVMLISAAGKTSRILEPNVRSWFLIHKKIQNILSQQNDYCKHQGAVFQSIRYHLPGPDL